MTAGAVTIPSPDNYRTGETCQLLDLLQPKSDTELEAMAQRARMLTRRHFGQTISLYAPLYLSNYCSGGCVYCGFASDREQPRTRLSKSELNQELSALRQNGLDDILLLTGERTEKAGFDYVLECVETAAETFDSVGIETFAMSDDEYRQLVDAGCTSITLYQETYDRKLYANLHRWGPKRDYANRIEAPARALAAGMRSAGLGVLLGLKDPAPDLACLMRHALYLRRKFWKSGVMLSFPRICAQQGGYEPAYEISDRFLAQAVFAFRICLPDVPLVLSTRENRRLRDNLAGTGISRMSVASRTTVGGYRRGAGNSHGQFEVNDNRDVDTFCGILHKKGLEPVFKNWDACFHMEPTSP